MRYFLLPLSMLLFVAIPTHARIGVDNRLPGVNIRINPPTCPQLIQAPSYPDRNDRYRAIL